MTKLYRIYQLDSFTKEIFKGNPAGVVTNADGLTEAQMQSIARELNNSETAFILSPADTSHDVHVRFFTPRTEVPICGHATIAAHYIRAKENNFETCTVVQKTGAGILPVDIIKSDDDYKIYMTQGKIEFQRPFDAVTLNRICSALQLSVSDLDERCPVQIVSTGHSKVLTGIKSLKKLNSLQPDMTELVRISKQINCNGYFVFTLDSDESSILTKGRMFAPAIGINEDPVTGNANGPLGAYLLKHKIVNSGIEHFSFRGKQGEAINRTGTIDVEVAIKDGEPQQVKIGGEAKIVFRTELEL